MHGLISHNPELTVFQILLTPLWFTCKFGHEQEFLLPTPPPPKIVSFCVVNE